MRDDRNKWPSPVLNDATRGDATRGEPTSAETETVSGLNITLSRIKLQRQVWVSGTSALQRFKCHSWPSITPGFKQAQAYSVCLRRDRVLLVNGTLMKDGWDAQLDLAITEVSDSYYVFKLVGENSLAVLRRGTEISLTTPSASAMRKLFGYDVVLYRTAEIEFCLHIDRANAESFWAHLVESIDNLA